MPATDDEIREKYLERAIRELNALHARPAGLRPLPARQPHAGARLGPPPGRRLPAQARRATGRDRGGRRLLRARGHGADEVAQAPGHRPAGGLRDAVRQVPGGDPALADPACMARVVEELAIVAAADRRRDGRRGARRAQRPRRAARAPAGARAGRHPASSRRRSTRSWCPTSTRRSTTRPRKRAFWSAFRVLGRLVRGAAAVLACVTGWQISRSTRSTRAVPRPLRGVRRAADRARDRAVGSSPAARRCARCTRPRRCPWPSEDDARRGPARSLGQERRSSRACRRRRSARRRPATSSSGNVSATGTRSAAAEQRQHVALHARAPPAPSPPAGARGASSPSGGRACPSARRG